MASPVFGLRPVLAFLFDTLNVPNPTRVTFRPFFKVALIESSAVLTALDASALLSPALEATFSISSSFVIKTTPYTSKSII
jgi:hypothetical protein